METILNTIKKSLVSSEDVLISGFGKFCIKEKSQRRGRNPATGVDLILEARRVVTFKCSEVLKTKPTTYPYRIMLYIGPSFDSKAIVDGREEYIKEFCLEPDRTYYAFAEKFIFHLPPLRFLPFIPRRKATWLLALSDKPLDKGRPVYPLIQTRIGMTG